MLILTLLLEIFTLIVIFTVIQVGRTIFRWQRALYSEAVRIQTAKSLEMRLDSLTCLGEGDPSDWSLAVAVRLLGKMVIS